MLFYKLLLEKESFHSFKRFYLLGALFLSIGIPFITFTHYVEATPIASSDIEMTGLLIEQATTNTSWNDYIPNLLWSIYLIGIVIFSSRLLIHLHQMYLKIKNNIKLKSNSFTNVLLLDNINPHTFFKYIFLNKYKYERNAIPKEVLLHEQTHAKQLHALDILIIELIHVVFWFNPLIYFLKKDIKLNHEFLADQSVINKGVEPSVYQTLLLAFSSNAPEEKLANAINYSLIKKRFTVMKTQTSKTSTWIKSLVLLPLLAFMVYGFSSTNEVIKNSENGIIKSSDYTARSISINVLEGGIYSIDGLKANKNSFVSIVNKLHQDITPEIRNNIMNIHVSYSSEISKEEIWFIYDSLLDYGFYRLVTDEQEIVKGKGNTPFLNAPTQDYQEGASREQMAEYNKLAKHYNAMSKKNMRVIAKDIERMKYIYSLMSEKQRKDAEPFPNIPAPPPAPDAVSPDLPPPPPLPENATKEQEIKYEKAIKLYKEKAAKAYDKAYKMKTLKKEKENNRAELGEMKKKYVAERAVLAETKKARVAEIKELSEAKKARVAVTELNRRSEKAAVNERRNEELKLTKLKRVEENKALKEERKTLMVERNKEMAEIKLKRTEELKKLKGNLAEVELIDITPPPPPQKPLDHVIEMSKKGAKFYLEGREITSDLAIDTIKSNKKVSIETEGRDSKKPKVYITIGPPVIKD
jgi:hypothetical protein